MFKLAVITVMLSTLLVGSADARERVGKVAPVSAGLTPPASRPADGQLWEEVKLAQAYWAARGFSSCELVVPSIAEIPANATWSPEENEAAQYAEEWTEVGSCRTQLLPDFAAVTREGPLVLDYLALRYECAVVVHGAGHALGLTHDAAERFPVMEQGFWDGAIPGTCRAWARRIVRARKATARALRDASHRR